MCTPKRKHRSRESRSSRSEVKDRCDRRPSSSEFVWAIGARKTANFRQRESRPGARPATVPAPSAGVFLAHPTRFERMTFAFWGAAPCPNQPGRAVAHSRAIHQRILRFSRAPFDRLPRCSFCESQASGTARARSTPRELRSGRSAHSRDCPSPCKPPW